MIRGIVYAITFAAVLIVAPLAHAEPGAVASDHGPNASPAIEQPAPPAASRSSSPDAPAAAGSGRDKGFIPVGFGWG